MFAILKNTLHCRFLSSCLTVAFKEHARALTVILEGSTSIDLSSPRSIRMLPFSSVGFSTGSLIGSGIFKGGSFLAIFGFAKFDLEVQLC